MIAYDSPLCHTTPSWRLSRGLRDPPMSRYSERSLIGESLPAKRRKERFPDLFVLRPHTRRGNAGIDGLECSSQRMQQRFERAMVKLWRHLEMIAHIAIKRALAEPREVIDIDTVVVDFEVVAVDAAQSLAGQQDREAYRRQAPTAGCGRPLRAIAW